MRLAFKFFYRYIVVVSLVVMATCAWSGALPLQECNNNGFSNSYYIVKAEDIASVSGFFTRMKEDYFEGLESFTARIGSRERTEIYFDNENFGLLKRKKELVHVIEENLPIYRQEREHIIYRDNDAASSAVQLFEVKHYNKKATPLDKHKLFGLVKRKERPVLLEILGAEVNGDPGSIALMLEVKHKEVVYLISHFGKAYGAVTLGKLHIENYGIPNTFTLLKIELFTDSMGSLNIQEKNNLEAIVCGVNKGFRDRFPHIIPGDWIGYADYYQLINSVLPNQFFFKQHPLLFRLGQIFILSLVGFLVLYLFVGRYSKKNSYRVRFRKGARRHNSE